MKPAPEKGPNGHALFRLRDAVNALVDANLLGTSVEAWRERCSDGGRESGARELAERVCVALAKRRERSALRVVLEVVAKGLHAHIGRVYDREDDAENFHGAALDWSIISEAELEAALRSLIEEGYLPDDGEAEPS